MPEWLPYLLVLAVVVLVWFVIRAWRARHPTKPMDEKRLAELHASAEARERWKHDRGGGVGGGSAGGGGA